MQGSAGVVSTVNDLLTYYDAGLTAWKHETRTNSKTTHSSLLEDVVSSLDENIPLERSSNFHQYYGIGWAVSELPAPLGQIGINPMLVTEIPTVAKGVPERKTVWHHNRSFIGFLSSVHILPDTDTAIVVLTSSLAR